ncbi:MAG: hypothetical protein GY822_32240 [Deltaproteobacteria bacterium]|nr:hypothetical protein [Deltaproteobacteria bacterium]
MFIFKNKRKPWARESPQSWGGSSQLEAVGAIKLSLALYIPAEQIVPPTALKSVAPGSGIPACFSAPNAKEMQDFIPFQLKRAAWEASCAFLAILPHFEAASKRQLRPFIQGFK